MLDTKIYQKENQLSLGRILKESILDIRTSLFLARQLAVRDINAQYRQSFLGIIWAFIGPISTALVWIFLNSTGTVRITDTGVPYPIYAFTGALLWSIIVEAINSPMLNTSSARSILSKLNFPKEALIVSGIYKLLFNSSIKIVLVLVFILVFGVNVDWNIVWFPLGILGAIFFGTTIGLLVTPLGLLYKDIGRLIAFVLKFLMYATPVVYAVPANGILRSLMEINPFTPIIETTRDFVTGQSPEYLMYFIWVLVACVPLFLIALVFYRISIPIIVERLSA